MTPSHHLNGDGCPNCAGSNRTLEDVINESIEMFPLAFDFSKAIFVNMHTPISMLTLRHKSLWFGLPADA